MKTKLVCIECGEDWIGDSSPNYCPKCGKRSAAITVEVKK